MSRAWAVGGEVTPSFLGLVNKAAELARQKGLDTDAVVVRPELGAAEARSLRGAGAKRVLQLPLDCADLNAESAAASALAELWRREPPEFILFESSVFFCDTAPAFAALTGCGITADCTELRWDGEGRLLQIRPAFGGRKLASNICVSGSPVATVRRGVFHLEPASADPAEIIRLSPLEASPSWTLLESCIDESRGPELGGADIIVSGGLGMGSREGFDRLYRLASLMGAAVGASRAAVAAGFAGYDRQVGQTGISVRPRLYIAFGISGAVQHLSGITAAGRIVAVNTDPRAPIHDYSDLSVIADCGEVIELLLQRLEGGATL